MSPLHANLEDESIAKIARKLREYASLNGATEIRLEHPSDGEKFLVEIQTDPLHIAQMKEVFALCDWGENEEWTWITRLPFSIWHQLKSHLQKLAGDDGMFEEELPSKIHKKSRTYTLTLDASPSQHGETIILKLNGPS